MIEIGSQNAQNINNFVIGSTDDERLEGEKSQDESIDILVGVGGRDVLVGEEGSDRFLLGKTDSVQDSVDFGLEDGAFYSEAGDDDYAVIRKFNSDQDIIELVGEKSEYTLGATSGDLPEGTGIFRGDELLGIIEDQSDLSLDADYFETTL
jgi:endoglucanase